MSWSRETLRVRWLPVARPQQRVAADRPGPWDLFQRELDRSRRFDRPMTLLRFFGVDPTIGGSGGAGLLQVVQSALRSIDLAWYEDDVIFVLLPETTAEASKLVRRRLSELAGRWGVVGVRTSSFPDDGITTRALLAPLLKEGAGNRVEGSPPSVMPSRDVAAMNLLAREEVKPWR